LDTTANKTNCLGQTSGRMAGDERRQQILQVAMDLFSQKGFRGTTTKEIAHAAGVSEAMVFRHFANKDELYSAIIDYKALCSGGLANPREHLEKFTILKDDYSVFYNLALTALNHHDDDRHFMRLLLHAALEEHQLSQMFFERYVVEMYDFLGNYIRQRQEDGAFRDINPKIIVRAFLGMVIHHSLNKHLWDREGNLLQVSHEEAAHNFTDILLRGIRN
jgi:AcrR family transcriptional regulator